MRYPGPSGISLHSAGKNTIARSKLIAYQYDPTGSDGNRIIFDYHKDAPSAYNNIIYIVQGSGVSSVRSDRATILHKTIVEAGTNQSDPKNGMGIRLWDTMDISNIIANNIIFEPRNGGIAFVSNTLRSQTYVDYNLTHVKNGSPISVVFYGTGTSDTHLTLADEKIADTFIHSLDSDPLFISPETLDFSLAPTSPARASGSSRYTVPNDFFGTMRARDNATMDSIE